jgi:hypothetical protein
MLYVVRVAAFWDVVTFNQLETQWCVIEACCLHHLTYLDDGDSRILYHTTQHSNGRYLFIYYFRNIKCDIGTSSGRSRCFNITAHLIV